MAPSDTAIQKYYERRQVDLSLCLEAISAKDFTTIEKIAHRLKGNGETFGFPELSELGKQMEEAAEAADSEITERCILAFKRWVHSRSPVAEL